MTTHHNENVQKLAGLIRDIEVAMVTTEDERGELRCRPMATQKTPFDGTLWFLTYDSSPKVAELKSHQKINVSYSDPRFQRYVSISGSGRVIRDPALVKKMWSPGLLAWFPKGMDDPAISLIGVGVHQAEFWEAADGRMVQLAGFDQTRTSDKLDRTG